MAKYGAEFHRIGVSRRSFGSWCRRWRVKELELFGSALRADFDRRSDIDLLVTFEPGTRWSLIDHVRMEDELAVIVGRKVDLLTKRAVVRSQNPIRRAAILGTAQVVYVA